uniref:NADH dehydrogenase [ubiquinone] 1 beta subcomplex subunit 9 n=1 Tax=Clastoptera arizonana TaxID=38151 RepID=A0A1B6CL42_9HEMI
MAIHIPLVITSHSRRVCKLYKRALRELENYYHYRPQLRYEATLMRARFDQNRNIKDPEKARKLLEDGEREVFKTAHYQPKVFPNQIGGIAYGRDHQIADWILDYWHPLEKAQYPEYFARREQRKKEFIEFWEKQYGKPTQDDAHH